MRSASSAGAVVAAASWISRTSSVRFAWRWARYSAVSATQTWGLESVFADDLRNSVPDQFALERRLPSREVADARRRALKVRECSVRIPASSNGRLGRLITLWAGGYAARTSRPCSGGGPNTPGAGRIQRSVVSTDPAPGQHHIIEPWRFRAYLTPRCPRRSAAWEEAAPRLVWCLRGYRPGQLWWPATYTADLGVPMVWRHNDVPRPSSEVVTMAAATPTSTQPRHIRRIDAASLIGTTVEWYDNSSDQGYDLPFPWISVTEVSTEPARVEDMAAWYRRSGVVAPANGWTGRLGPTEADCRVLPSRHPEPLDASEVKGCDRSPIPAAG
ncbi:hypothetical protein BCL76_11770 [Streptomyces sp. CG 926]|nr:hypothetical protein BCL76_11770 [Streptomyces sp. CG 926]